MTGNRVRSQIVGSSTLAFIALIHVEVVSAFFLRDRIGFHVDMWVYYQYHKNPYFSDRATASFAESMLRLRTSPYNDESLEVNLGATLASVVGDSKDLTGSEDEIETVIDLWNFELRDLFNSSICVKIGRQELGFGDGFLIWDGVSETAGVWSNALRSFYAGRVTYSLQPFVFDFIAALTEDDFVVYDAFLQGYKGRNRLYGAHAHLETERLGSWNFGVFYRDDTSELGNDTLAISLRGEYVVPNLSIVPLLSGEIVKEYGDTKLNGGTLSGSTQDRDAWGGHIDLTLYFKEMAFSPFIRLSFVYLSGDDPGSSDVEAYDPLFVGWVDWSKWWIGEINSWEVSMTNERVWMLEAGVNFAETTKIRVQLFEFRLNEEIMPGGDRQWSREVNLVFEWYPTERFTCGAIVGYAYPRAAAKRFNNDNDDVVEFGSWVGISF